MAAYPSIRYTLRSRIVPTDTLEVVRADNGTPYFYAYGSSVKDTIELEHIVSAADLATLRAFYAANRTAGGVTLTFAGTAYTCAFSDPPEIEPLGGSMWRCVMSLAQQ